LTYDFLHNPNCPFLRREAEVVRIMGTRLKILLTACALGLLAMPAWAQSPSSSATDDAIAGYESAAHQSFQGIATDWSSHHVVFSKPEPGSDAEDSVQQDPRYWMQQIRRSQQESGLDVASQDESDSSAKKVKKAKGKKNKKNTLNGLWSVNLDNGATVGNEMYPATFTSLTSPNCSNTTQPDFVVYNTNVAGGTPATATANPAGTFSSGNNTPAGTYIITNGTNSVTLTASATLNTGLNFQVVNNSGGGNDTNATNLAAAINRNNAAIGVTASSSTNAVAITASSAGTDGNSITLTGNLSRFTFDLAALAGGTNAATIIAFDNLYGGSPTPTCGGEVPTPYWSYNTGGTDRTSPVISAAGNQVAFIQTVGTAANLAVLKYAAGNGHLGSVTLMTNSSYPSCTAPCMISLPFANSANDTNSSPFYVFGGADTIYVGDNAGKLHKFTNIFLGGTPAEVTTGGWPVTVGTGTQVLSSPVVDVNTHNIFLSDAAGNLRYVKDTGSTTGVCSSTSNLGAIPCLGTTNGVASGLTAIALGGTTVDGPLLDVTTTKVFWFDAVAGTNTTDLTDNLVQTDEAVTSSTDVKIAFSSGLTGVYTGNMHEGAFDNTYFASGPATGLLYVCAIDDVDGDNNRPSLYSVGFTSSAGVMKASPTGGPLNIASPSVTQNECSPITEIQTASTDDFFVSVQANGNGNLQHCSVTTGCIFSFALTSETFPTQSTAGLAAMGGTSGVSIDNTFTAAGTSQVYFTPLANQACTTGGTGGCATQASQAGLE
jgi:hypothetical protein